MPFSALTRRALVPRQARRSWKVGIRGQHFVVSDVLAQVSGTVGEQGNLQREEGPRSGSDGSTQGGSSHLHLHCLQRLQSPFMIIFLYPSQLGLKGPAEILLLNPEAF